jgi:phosphate transport system permease protein
MNNNEQPAVSVIGATSARFRRWRAIKDKTARVAVTVGGLAAIFAILLIFIFLFIEVLPLFKSASINEQATYQIPLGANEQQPINTVYLSIEEQAEVGMRVSAGGEVVFFKTTSGDVIETIKLSIPAGTTITSVASDTPTNNRLALGLSDGSAVVVQHEYVITYPNDKRTISPAISYPYGETPLLIDDAHRGITKMAMRDTEKSLLLVGQNDENTILVNRYKKTPNPLTEEVSVVREVGALPKMYNSAQQLLVTDNQRWLFIVNEQHYIDIYDLRKVTQPTLNDRVNVADKNSVTGVEFLLGGTSLIIGDSQGQVSQWFMVRDKQNNFALKKIRSFDNKHTASVSQMTSEQRRKGFLVVDQTGELSIYNSTANRRLLTKPLTDETVQAIALSPRANTLLVATDKKIGVWNIHNEHPEVSWSSLWEKVWYEGYEKPDYIWQSSASTTDFEPKYSLMPLAFGTLKAAFYAMLVGTPLAICAAIYTAYFMAPRLRRKVKPTIELMAALPTVILGFLAGLWLAPYVEKHLAGIFCLLLIIPIGVFVFSFIWFKVLGKLFHSVTEGWDALVLVPVILFLGWLSLTLSVPIEDAFFNGDMRLWLSKTAGIAYDQRNALVVGLAMGFAVIPSIFSIAEDAIFSVPKHLSYGSLALGATPWQTLTRVVLLTASPGIFSAVMIGMGRAVGETMIVLMATGNTPIMDANIFQGMRTLAANIAVEMAESEVGGTHYRVLFLAALVLFLFTFVVNTLAEVVRQRLRKRYESL